jgi:hypothetical protein
VGENTVEMVPVTVEISMSPDMSGARPGPDAKLALLPGIDYYFRVKYTSSSFASEVYHLEAPERPVINTAVGDTIEDEFFMATVDFHSDATGFDATGVEATNATVYLTEPLTIKIVPVGAGVVNVSIIANAILSGNFASDTLTTWYREIPSSVPEHMNTGGSLIVFPNPFRDLLHAQTTGKLILPVEISLLNTSGLIVIQKKMVSSKALIDLRSFPDGLYILKAVDSKGNVIACKIIKQ